MIQFLEEQILKKDRRSRVTQVKVAQSERLNAQMLRWVCKFQLQYKKTEKIWIINTFHSLMRLMIQMIFTEINSKKHLKSSSPKSWRCANFSKTNPSPGQRNTSRWLGSSMNLYLKTRTPMTRIARSKPRTKSSRQT